MPSKPDFFESFYTEAMSEMAKNFFARRKEMEERLEGFSAVAALVRLAADKTLRRYVTFFTLAMDESAALAFLEFAQATVPDLMTQVGAAGAPWPLKTPFAFTLARKHQKALEQAYENVRQAVIDYRHGGYGPDPRDPRRKVLSPNLEALKQLAQSINAEVELVNSAQPATTVLAYAKSLDPQSQSREAVTGGLLGEDIGKIDRDMAFAPVDFNALGLPDFKEPKPLDAVCEELARLGQTVRNKHARQEILDVLQAVAMRNA